ncbi:MAG: hypothetical protein J7L34_06625 [Thermotogaceae bacterium]|nr:hypothetical protein [Thermotogaceae bacterium]
MVNPVEVQTFVVRAVDAAQNVNQLQNAVLAGQHTSLLERVQRNEVERSQVNAQNKAEGKSVRNSMEGSNRGSYLPYRRRGSNAQEEEVHPAVTDEKRGLILDVRL